MKRPIYAQEPDSFQLSLVDYVKRNYLTINEHLFGEEIKGEDHMCWRLNSAMKLFWGGFFMKGVYAAIPDAI